MCVFAIEVPAPIRAIAGQWAEDYAALTKAVFIYARPDGVTDRTLQAQGWVRQQLDLFRELSRADVPVLATDQVLSAIEQTAQYNLDPASPDGLTEEAAQVLAWLAGVEKRPVWIGR